MFNTNSTVYRYNNTAVISKAYYFNYYYSKLFLPGECLVGLLNTAEPLLFIIAVLNTAYYIIITYQRYTYIIIYNIAYI